MICMRQMKYIAPNVMNVFKKSEPPNPASYWEPASPIVRALPLQNSGCGPKDSMEIARVKRE